MRRRHFISIASGCLLLPTALGTCLASVVTRGHDYNFVDDRFPEARRLAAAWFTPDARVAVQGDITALWKEWLERRVRAQPLRLRGVTTESFRFCLLTLSREHAGVEAQVSRLDRNLHQWTLITTPNPNTGIHHA